MRALLRWYNHFVIWILVSFHGNLSHVKVNIVCFCFKPANKLSITLTYLHVFSKQSSNPDIHLEKKWNFFLNSVGVYSVWYINLYYQHLFISASWLAKKIFFCIVIKVRGCAKVALPIPLTSICCLIMPSTELSADKMIKHGNSNDLLQQSQFIVQSLIKNIFVKFRFGGTISNPLKPMIPSVTAFYCSEICKSCLKKDYLNN